MGGLIRPTGDFKENSDAPGTVTLVASDSGGLLFQNGAFVEQTPGRDARILLKFPESLRPQDVTFPEVESFPLRLSYAQNFAQNAQVLHDSLKGKKKGQIC